MKAGAIPDCVHTRLMSVRAYDAAHMIIDAAVCDGKDVAREIERVFGNEDVAYVHLHNAKRGCFAALVSRV
jgi:hypothetical protein